MSKPQTLGDFVGESRQSGEQINFKHCPVCGSDNFKLYVNPATGFWYCHAAQHAGGGRVDAESMAMASAEGQEILRMLAGYEHSGPTAELELPEWEPLSRSASNYLLSRGIGPAESLNLSLVECEDERRILIPYYDILGRLVYWNSRLYSDRVSGTKYKAAPGRHPLYVPKPRLADKMVVVEGVFDAMAVARHTPYHAVAIGGKSLPKYLHQPLRDQVTNATFVEEVIIALDGEALADAVKLKEQWRAPCPVRIAVFKDGEDPANVTCERLNHVLDG